jgi:uncharacterized protein involved in exopolysaccharide biosynthesis
LVVAFAVSVLPDDYYRSTTLIAVQGQQSGLLGELTGSGLGALGSLAGINIDAESRREEFLAVFGSREFIIRFVRTHGLLAAMYADRWDLQLGDWRKDVDPEDLPSDEEIFKRFTRKYLDVYDDRSSGLVRIGVRLPEPKLAADSLNAMVADANALLQSRAVAENTQAIEYLEDELRRTSVEDVRQALLRVVEAKYKDNALAHSSADYAFRVLDRAIPQRADKPEGPNRLALFLGVLMIGLALVVALRVNGSGPSAALRGIAARFSDRE